MYTVIERYRTKTGRYSDDKAVTRIYRLPVPVAHGYNNRIDWQSMEPCHYEQIVPLKWRVYQMRLLRSQFGLGHVMVHALDHGEDMPERLIDQWKRVLSHHIGLGVWQYDGLPTV